MGRFESKKEDDCAISINKKIVKNANLNDNILHYAVTSIIIVLESKTITIWKIWKCLI